MSRVPVSPPRNSAMAGDSNFLAGGGMTPIRHRTAPVGNGDDDDEVAKQRYEDLKRSTGKKSMFGDLAENKFSDASASTSLAVLPGSMTPIHGSGSMSVGDDVVD